MIDVREISKFYGDKKAVNELTLKIDDGETIGLLGLNGAGKSTVLKILGCFLMPSTGEAYVGGYSVVDQPQDVRRQIGFLPDTPPLYPEMRVDDYLAFAARLKSVPAGDVAARVAEAMTKTNLDEVRDLRLAELSHGFQQRVGIAQAIVHNPRVLILDEPINGLDPIQIVEMRDLIRSLKGEHTVLLSSHILSEITKTCDRILVLDHGQLVAEGSEYDLRNKVKQALEIQVEWQVDRPELIPALQALAGVNRVEVSSGNGTCQAKLLCEKDLRAEVAKTIVAHEAGLLALARKEAELESLFLRLVNKEAANG